MMTRGACSSGGSSKRDPKGASHWETGSLPKPPAWKGSAGTEGLAPMEPERRIERLRPGGRRRDLKGFGLWGTVSADAGFGLPPASQDQSGSSREELERDCKASAERRGWKPKGPRPGRTGKAKPRLRQGPCRADAPDVSAESALARKAELSAPRTSKGDRNGASASYRPPNGPGGFGRWSVAKRRLQADGTPTGSASALAAARSGGMTGLRLLPTSKGGKVEASASDRPPNRIEGASARSVRRDAEGACSRSGPKW
jgi:hypothetical protein